MFCSSTASGIQGGLALRFVRGVDCSVENYCSESTVH